MLAFTLSALKAEINRACKAALPTLKGLPSSKAAFALQFPVPLFPALSKMKSISGLPFSFVLKIFADMSSR